MSVSSGAQSTEANLNATTPAAPSGSKNVTWQASSPYPDPNNPSYEVRDISAYVANLGGVDARTTTSETIGIASQGKLVTFSNAGAIAAALNNSSVAAGFMCAAENIGAGTATLTPSAGTIDGAGSLALVTNEGCLLFFDGTNWKVVRGKMRALVAADIPNIAESQVTSLVSDLAAKATQAGVQAGSYDYAADSGAADAYAVTLSPVPTLAAGLTVVFKAANTNTTTSTLNVNSLGAKTIKKLDGATNLAAGDIVAGQIITCVYDGTNFQMESPVANASGGGGSGTVTHTGGALTAHRVVVGNGSDDVEVIAALGSAGQYLRSGGASTDPAFATPTPTEVGLSNVTNDAQLKAADLDNDTALTANSATKIASQHATKTYADTKVAGPGSATASDFAQFDGTTGKLIKDTGLALDTDGTLAANSDSKIASQKAVKTYVDTNTGVGGSAAYFGYGGDGSDGSVTFDGSTTILGLAPSSSVYTLTRDIFCSQITVNSGVTIIGNNFGIWCSGTLTNNGTIKNDGATGAAGTNTGATSVGGGGGGAPSVTGSATGHYPRQPGGTGLAGTAGGNGGTTTGTQAPAANTGSALSACVDASGVVGSSGNAGGQGGTGTSGAGGAARGGGAASATPPAPAAQIGHDAFHASLGYFAGSAGGGTSAYNSPNNGNGGAPGGSGGGGDGVNSGAGGGGGGGEGGIGGLMGIFAASIVNGASGIIRCNGGAGGQGGNGGTPITGNTGGGGGGAGGSGGRGGILWLVYHKLTNSGTIQASGGAPGTHGSKGSPHGTGTNNAADGSDGPTGPSGVVIQIQC